MEPTVCPSTSTAAERTLCTTARICQPHDSCALRSSLDAVRQAERLRTAEVARRPKLRSGPGFWHTPRSRRLLVPRLRGRTRSAQRRTPDDQKNEVRVVPSGSPGRQIYRRIVQKPVSYHDRNDVANSNWLRRLPAALFVHSRPPRACVFQKTENTTAQALGVQAAVPQ